MKFPVDYKDILTAKSRVSGVIRRTPVDYSTTFSRITGQEVFFKYENLQKTGSFKIRGALNKMASLTEQERASGVIAASAGNHAQGVALAASMAGVESTIVMPEGVPIAKLMATKEYGSKVVLSGQSYDEAYIKAEQIKEETKAVFVHAFNDSAIIAGQGTVGLEILEDLPNVNTVVVPIGGGGLISGIALAVKQVKPQIRIIGVQAEGAPSMKNAVTSGEIRESSNVSTIADGIAIKHPGDLTFSIVKELVDDIVLVNDEDIAQAILMMIERNKLTCEGAGAAGIAALLGGEIKGPGKILTVITGGNIDIHTLSIIIERGLTKAGRYVRLKTVVVDRPGALQKLLGIVAETKANVISVAHNRILTRVPITQAEVSLDLETRDPEHVENIMKTLSDKGYRVIKEEYQ